MKKILILVLVIISTITLFAQKKLVSVSESPLTGIKLPAGSLQDKRMLSVSSANMLMDMESKKTGRSVSTTEVFVLPSANTSGFDGNMLVKTLSEKGWKISVVKDDNKYAWLQMENQLVIMYFSMGAKESSLFFSKTSATAIQSVQVNNNSSIQNVQTGQTQLPKSSDIPIETKQKVTESQPVLPVSNIGFAFTTINFNDGWVATEQPDWVRVSKGNTVVLIHYAQPNIRDFSNLDEKTAFVWNTIVAPRYSNIANLWIRKSWYADGDFMNGKYFAEADLIENSSGEKVHVVLYKNGSAGKWLEFITPDKPTFQNQFDIVYQQDGTNWNKLSAMGNYNKFAVSSSDLPGNWKSSSGAGIEYYNVYTGNSMGMASASSTTEFIFRNDGTYTSVYKGVDGFNGNNRYVGETYIGKTIVTDWEMKLTNRFNGATESFAIQFEAVKGGRILHMYRGNIEELHLFRTK